MKKERPVARKRTAESHMKTGKEISKTSGPGVANRTAKGLEGRKKLARKVQKKCCGRKRKFRGRARKAQEEGGIPLLR